MRERLPAEAEMDAGYLLETFLENTPDHVYFKDLEGRFTRISMSLVRWLGVDDMAQALGRSDVDFFDASHAEHARAAELEVMRTGEPIIGLEERELWQDGRVSWVSTTKVPLRSRSGEVIGIFGLARDITARKLAEQHTQQQAAELERLAAQLEQLTLHDELTGLYNLRGLELLGGGAVDRSARDGSALCVLFLDLDGLKAINDGFGHAAGDAALIAAAGVLRGALRRTDVIARIGGDEFGAVLVGTSPAEAAVLCDRVRRDMKDHAPGEHSLSVSIGVAAARPGKGDTLDELIAAADDAMYAGRRRRRRPQRA
ncbi:MAG: diguanylate cyclase [Actinomycetota bacterium]|nr:diguanylate cyclase [Actinomycetota bacterium]